MCQDANAPGWLGGILQGHQPCWRVQPQELEWVLDLLHHPGEVPSLPLPVSIFKIMSFSTSSVSFPLMWGGSGTWAAWDQSLCFRVQGGWMWGLGEQWHHQLLGWGWRGCAGALLLPTQAGNGASLCSCPSEGILTTAGGWCLTGGESRASSGPSNPLVPFPSSPDPTDAQVWVQAKAQ